MMIEISTIDDGQKDALPRRANQKKLQYKLGHYPDPHCTNILSFQIGCQYCPSPNMFYCDMSKTCIQRSQVCDQTSQCSFKEDER